MPYSIEEKDGEFLILERGKVVGHSKTRKDAEASIRARYAGEFGKVKEETFIPPESGNAPEKLKAQLAAVYSSIRSKWVKEHPEDKENKANKESAAAQAWAAVENAGWHKDKDGNWKLKEEKWDSTSGKFIKEGGGGSGNFGHTGRPGERGGSGGGGVSGVSGNNTEHKWNDINTALMKSNFNAPRIMNVISALNKVEGRVTTGNSVHKWGDINKALMSIGVKPAVIADILGRLPKSGMSLEQMKNWSTSTGYK